jgi:excisionase family DNA binding protein
VTDIEVDPSALKLLTIEDVAAQLRLSPVTIWRKVRSGEIESVKIGRSRRFTPDQVTAYVDSLVARHRKGAA